MRKPKRIMQPRRPRVVTTEGKPRIYVPARANMTGVLLEQGPEQSIVFLDDTGDPYLIREWCLPNDKFKFGQPRVRLKIERVRLKE